MLRARRRKSRCIRPVDGWRLLEIDHRLGIQDALAERLRLLLRCHCLQRGGDAVSSGVGLVVALITILVLNEEFRASLRERPPAPGSRPSPAIRRTRAPGQADEVVRAGTARERDAAEDAES